MAKIDTIDTNIGTANDTGTQTVRGKLNAILNGTVGVRVVKSIQRGVVGGGSAGSGSVSISPVNAAKSILTSSTRVKVVSSRQGSTSSGGGYYASVSGGGGYCYNLTDTGFSWTSTIFQENDGSSYWNAASPVYWEIVEYY